jgi:signal transduction histidine kinase
MKTLKKLYDDFKIPGGTVTISCRLVGEEDGQQGAWHFPKCHAPLVEFALTDTGCGMSPELQAHLFEPFVTKGKPHGTGLGMTIVVSGGMDSRPHEDGNGNLY